MSYSIEKEYIKRAFMDEHLDVSSGFESVKRFVEIMSGEMEALIAIDHCRFLSDKQVDSLMQIAQPNRETLREYQGWLKSIHGPVKECPK